MIQIRNRKFTAYEQDIRELLQAFFPGEEITENGTGEASFRISGSGENPETEEALDLDALIPEEQLQGNRFEDKTVIKRSLYEAVSAETGRTLPWGTLTGIKPVKLADRLLQAGLSPEEAERTLAERYLVSPEKRALVMKIALRERELLRALPRRGGYSFYAGIPFCPTRCLYCSFTSNPVSRFESRIGEYLGDLEQELKSFSAFCEEQTGDPLPHPSTVYIGGGTPTALSAEGLETLLSCLERFLPAGGPLEFTVEAGRPDSITEEKLLVLKRHGVDRISVNPQTMNQKTLDLIGRRHTAEQTLEAFALARRLGFSNINMDVIMGLPGEDLQDVRHTLAVIRDLGPESLTVHSLAVKRAARLSTEHDPWREYRRAEGEEVSEMISLGAACAGELGMEPYYLYRQKNIAGNQENTGYALPGKESLYNIIMMEEKQPVIGFGAGSTTKLGSGAQERMENIKDLSQYLDRIGELLTKKEAFLRKNAALFLSPFCFSKGT